MEQKTDHFKFFLYFANDQCSTNYFWNGWSIYIYRDNCHWPHRIAL